MRIAVAGWGAEVVVDGFLREWQAAVIAVRLMVNGSMIPASYLAQDTLIT